MRDDPPRRFDPITRPVLDRLSEIAAEDRAELFARLPRWEPYGGRVLFVALCQGAALHYTDGENGVKDLDVWTFFAASEVGPFPHRRRRERTFDLEPFGGHYVDLLGRSLQEEPGSDPVEVVCRYLTLGSTSTARLLSQKAVVLLDPEPLRGTVAWSAPPTT